MYGFGDDMSPLPETLHLVEGIVLEYATTLLHKVGQRWWKCVCVSLCEGTGDAGGTA
jgi:hypothetical protein